MILIIFQTNCYVEGKGETQEDSLRHLFLSLKNKDLLHAYRDALPVITPLDVGFKEELLNAYLGAAQKQKSIEDQDIAWNALMNMYRFIDFNKFMDNYSACMAFFKKNTLWTSYFRMFSNKITEQIEDTRINKASEEAMAMYQFAKKLNNEYGK